MAKEIPSPNTSLSDADELAELQTEVLEIAVFESNENREIHAELADRFCQEK